MMRAVFLDRDGVVNAAVVRNGRPYPPQSLAEVVIPPGTAQALRRLADAGYLLLGCTNQPDVARGTTLRSTVEGINAHLLSELPIDEISVCWHDDKDDCACRKPKPGLVLEMAERHGVDVSQSWMIGDRWRDVACAKAAGCRAIFLDYGYEEEYRGPNPDFKVKTLTEAAEIILSGPYRSQAG